MLEVEKVNTLKSAGFFEIPVRQMWVSHDSRKAFSHQALRDHDHRWLLERFDDTVPDGSFYFYFNNPDGKAAGCLTILYEIGHPDLQAAMPISTRFRYYEHVRPV
jgi:hypothetical protein